MKINGQVELTSRLNIQYKYDSDKILFINLIYNILFTCSVYIFCYESFYLFSSILTKYNEVIVFVFLLIRKYKIEICNNDNRQRRCQEQQQQQKGTVKLVQQVSIEQPLSKPLFMK